MIVSQEEDAEIRRVSVTNLGARAREIELTSYAELVLAPPSADAAHAAFSNLFVQTESVADLGCLLGTRLVPLAAEAATSDGVARRPAIVDPGGCGARPVFHPQTAGPPGPRRERPPHLLHA